MKKQAFIASAVLSTLVGCASQPTDKAALEEQVGESLQPTASGISSKSLFFDSAKDAEKALAGYNYGLVDLPDGRVQAFVSGVVGSGADNAVTSIAQSSATSSSSATQLAQAGEESPFPAVTLNEKKNGQAAIDALGDSLGDVARAYDMSPERLQDILRNDSTAWIDEKGRLLYIDSLPKVPPQGEGPQAATTATTTGSTATVAATTDPFALHSKPGSNRLIYLDFNGHAAVNTAWYPSGTLNAQAYDIDGNPASFSASELNNIKDIWQRVAEDYAPFDVDVTTQEPTVDALRRTSSTDTQYGTRAVITRSMPELCSQSCGGVAYVNVYSWYSSTNPEQYQPAWVFFDKLGNGYPKYVAEAASHEVGHNLNLNHDGSSTVGYYQGHGTGATGWAPIMGVGYYQPVVQWSKGEYPGANNLQDDVAVIHAAGTPLRADDYPNSNATAAPLAGTASVVAQAGIIETSADVDVFTFSTAGGAAQFTVTPDPIAPNLDVQVKLLNAAGTVIAQANPVDALSATVTASLPAGQYYLQVEGVGKGDLTTGYSDYGSLGQYLISGSYAQGGSTANNPPTAVISAIPTTGTAPLTVSFNGANSSDSDGSIAGYNWNFGDGTADATGASVSHVYQAAGSYTATLTVTDNGGLKASTTQAIQASQPVVNSSIKVTSTSLSRKVSNTNSQCVASVTVKYGTAVVSGATVYGSWSGSATAGTQKITFTGTGSAATSTTGIATLASPSVPSNSKGSCAFTVTKVVKTGYTYDGSGAISGSFSW